MALERDEQLQVKLAVDSHELLLPWIEDVRLHWELEWRHKEPVNGHLHRYTKDFAAFLGERFLTDFKFR